MKRQVSRISIHQTSKVMSLIYFVISAIFCIPMAIFGVLSTGEMESLFMLLAPIFYLVFGYLMIAVFAWVYNLIAASFGGVEFTIQHIEEELILK